MRRSKLMAWAVGLPLAVFSSAAFAQTPGEASSGTGESPRGISTGTPPTDFTPRAVPVIEDPSVLDQIGREILDEEATRERFGATALSRDGTVTTIEASDEMVRAILGAGAPGAPQPQDDARSRFVGPQDLRQQVRDPGSYPVTAVGLLYSTFADGGSSCSATLIGPSTVITAAHCIYDHAEGWPSNIEYVPAMMDEATHPYGVWEFDTAYVLNSYITRYRGVYGEVVPYDLAVVTLLTPVGDELGWLGFGPSEEIQGFDATILSYPGDKPFGTMWHSNCDVSLAPEYADDLIFVHFCQTYAGSSGGSLFAHYPSQDEHRIYGINVAEVQGDDGYNIAVRMNLPYFQWVVERWK
ncbi:trypsin-like peptidase domain-containing protein [Alkalilacustris brevis]|uniref:trypsin-like peptidase domain-containing protein n=1 Tax=Alkalilacustris brevis TaxID=2026338 RepID=UPI000E0DDED2|nr:trypsin-like peptidase domain-containing protein [Alkalilacustris brevis]